MDILLLIVLIALVGVGIIISDCRACRKIWLLEQLCNQQNRIAARLHDISSTATGINFDTTELRIQKQQEKKQ